jgi:hypothetical protein
MCNSPTLTQTTQQPAPTDPTPSFDTGDGGFGQTIGANQTQSTVPVTGPTKLATLLKYALPIVQGGLVGWAGGKGHPQGGFGAANDFWERQRQYQMQQAVLGQQIQNNNINNFMRQAHAAYYLGRTPGGPGTMQATTPANPVAMPLKPGQLASEAPPDLDAAAVAGQTSAGPTGATSGGGMLPRTPSVGKPTLRDTSEGLMDVSGSEAVPVRARLPRAPSRFNSGTPTTADGTPVGGQLVPLKSVAADKPTNPMTDLESGAIASLRAQHPDWSDAQVYSAVKRAGQKPDKDESVITPQQERQFRSQYSAREETGLRQLQSEQEADLDKLNGGDPDTAAKIDPQYGEKKAAITQRYTDARKDLHQRLVTEASGLGIDLDTPMATKGNPRGPAGSGNPNDRIPIVNADGVAGTVPRSQLQKALKKGYKQAAAPN